MEARRVDNKSNGGSDISAALEKMTKGFSPFYKGDTDILRNRSAEIPAEENCSLFITGLSPTTTTPQLLGAIRNVGRVYATHINGPEPDRGHMTCAAKVVFFERAAAERFYARFHTGFHIPAHPNHTGRVVWNRIRSAEVDPNGRKSRVLLISGPKALVNETALRAYLSTKIQYQVEAVIPLHHATQRALIEFRFGSYRCQAEAARMALAREFKEYGVFCEFGKSFLSLMKPRQMLTATGRDPCDLESRRQFW
ncbi:hypothetical protein QBC34DRAFT_307968 [Podospora aff. communis PSN243]|uniref:RRM domain-containing protein n=1 Tax=Podospora aff. communis PSN243 TaxID=3040156 RepID=A0AAV9G9V6_9PEZI|nr:hypothetical protein QBC34DRAFT_307968 [Podospora aff. communis PSN243]